MWFHRPPDVRSSSDPYMKQVGPDRSDDWVEGIRRGDHDAFEACFRAYYETLYGVVRSYVTAPQVIEGLLQDLFGDLWRRRGELNPRKDLQAYLCGAARNKALEHLRRERMRTRWVICGEVLEEAQGDPAGVSPERKLRSCELEAAIRKVYAELPERRRVIFNLSRQHGLTYAEIASLLGISVKTVETQMGRALRLFRKRLAAFMVYQ